MMRSATSVAASGVSAISSNPCSRPSTAREAIPCTDGGARGALVGIGVLPVGDFVTYGVGVSVLGMRDTELARGRASAAASVMA